MSWLNDIEDVYECTGKCKKTYSVKRGENHNGDKPFGQHTCMICDSSNLISHGLKKPLILSVHSDNIGGIQGLKSMADGKMYDSKTAYYASLKEKGYEVVGNDAPTTRGTPKTEAIDWKQALHETYNQLSPTKKGKK